MSHGIDVEVVRADTPGCEHVAHLNNAGAALPPRPVVDAMVGHLELEARVGGYEAADLEADRIEATYGALARLIGARPDEMALTDSATRAWDMAFYAIPFAPGDRVVCATVEYASNFIPFLQAARHHGLQVDVVPDDESGQLDVGALRDMIDERVALVAITHVPTGNGVVNPAAEVGKVAREAGALYLLDACQSVGQLPVDVDEIGCDLLSATGRKYLRGPRGTGFLYCSRRVLDRLEPPFLDLHAATWTGRDSYEIRGDARRFESWESNLAARIGLGTAVSYALEIGLDVIEARVSALADGLRQRLRGIRGITVHDRGPHRCGIVTFTVYGRSPDEVVAALRERRINVKRTGAAAQRYDFDARGLTDVVRASVHYYNTEAELDRMCAALPRPTR